LWNCSNSVVFFSVSHFITLSTISLWRSYVEIDTQICSTSKANILKFKLIMCTSKKTNWKSYVDLKEKSTDQIFSRLIHNSSCCNINIVYIYVFVYLLFACHVCIMLYFSVVTSLFHCISTLENTKGTIKNGQSR
jgi:hypothetical protein